MPLPRGRPSEIADDVVGHVLVAVDVVSRPVVRAVVYLTEDHQLVFRQGVERESIRLSALPAQEVDEWPQVSLRALDLLPNDDKHARGDNHGPTEQHQEASAPFQ
jgi:hypothetical protein